MSITKGKRTVFTAAHLTPETKEALKKSARKRKKSISAVVSEAVEEKLEQETLVDSITIPQSEGTK